MKYTKNLLLLLLLVIPIVQGVTIQRDETYVIRTVNTCTGFIEVTDMDINPIYNYNIKDCERNDNIWICHCSLTPFNITLMQNVSENRNFNFMVRYFLKPELGNNFPNEYNLREYPHDGIFVEVTPRVKRLPPLTERSKSFIIRAVFGMLILIGSIIFFIIIIVNKYKKEGEDTSDLDNEEQDEYLRNHIK